MKKALVILLALLMLVSITACGGKEEPAPAPGPGTSAPAPAPGGSVDAPVEKDPEKTQPAELGYYDPEFDYTQYPSKKVAFLSMTAGELWDAYDTAYEHWCGLMNIKYSNIWAPTQQYNAEEFMSGLETFVDQGYDGFILEAGAQNYPQVAKFLDDNGIAWVPGLGGARDFNGALLHPQIGFDNFDVGVQITNKLVEWKEETYPDVPWEKVGLLCLDFGYNVDIHNRCLGMESRWAELFPEFGAYDPDVSKNPQNMFIGDIATAANPDQTAAQNLATQFLSNPGDIEIWLIGTPADLYSVGAANAAELMNMTDKVCTACHGGVAMPSRWEAGIEDSWRFAYYASQSLAGELLVSQLWAYMHELATPDTIYPEWVNPNDKGDVIVDGEVKEEHNYASMLTPLNFLEKDSYKEYLEWTDLYAYGEGADGVWAYEPVTDINLYPSRMEVPASYKG